LLSGEITTTTTSTTPPIDVDCEVIVVVACSDWWEASYSGFPVFVRGMFKKFCCFLQKRSEVTTTKLH
jgi:hypothetical protein